MKIKRVFKPDELNALFEFRQKMLVYDLHWMSAAGFKLQDKYDRFSHNYAAYNTQGEIIGSIRLVNDNLFGFPLERLYPLDKYREGKNIVEACRFSVAKKYRSTRTFMYLMAAAYQCALLTGSTHMVLDTYLNEEPLYKSFGFERISTPYTDPEYKRNALVVTMGTSIHASVAGLNQKKPLILNMLNQNNNIIEHGNLQYSKPVFTKSALY
ncbi:MAG: N-acyl amino acid synthase FeeM domain-containing protein [Bacteroidota bacterium]